MIDACSVLWTNTEVRTDCQQGRRIEERRREQLRRAARLAQRQDASGHEHRRIRTEVDAIGHGQLAHQFELFLQRHTHRMPQTRCEWIGNKLRCGCACVE